MIKNHIKIEEIKKATIGVLEQLENVAHFGHIDCNVKTKAEIEKDSEIILEKTIEITNTLQNINNLIIESYGY